MSDRIKINFPEIKLDGIAEATAVDGNVQLALAFGDNAIIVLIPPEDALNLARLLIDASDFAAGGDKEVRNV